MNWLIVKNDFKRNKVINLALLLFMTFSACLAVLSVMMAVQTFTSISELYETAQPPHFMQMHKGEISHSEIDAFMSDQDNVTHWQVVTTITVYGDSLTIIGREDAYDLSDLRLDIGLVKQNEEKDLLLSPELEKITLQKDEIGMPMLLVEKYDLQIGDQVVLQANGVTKKFKIKEFVLDSQMNSPMVSSTRILLNESDFDNLEGIIGENEYLIEVYFNDTGEASDFQTVYENAALPQNGQAVTYALIFLLSALTDITVVFVLLLVALLLIMVSFICVRFTIMAALEEEIREIGTMKAIGLPFKDIKNIYLYKYRALAAATAVAGYLVALLLSDVVTNHISTAFGGVRLSALSVLLSLVAGCVTFLIINYYCVKVLKGIKKVTVVDALVTGKGFGKNKGRVRHGIYKARRLSVNWLMGMREVFYRFRDWVIVFSVVLIAVMMIMIPVNLLNTFQAPEFITYMGSSLEDILIEVDNGENLEAGYADVKQLLKREGTVESYYEYRRVRTQTMDAENKLINLYIQCGDNAGNGLQYLSGEAPEGANEIAVSYLNSDAIGKGVSDTIQLFFDDKEMEFVISGVYQDVTSGGYTAKSKYAFPELSADKYSFSVNLAEKESAPAKADQLAAILGAGIRVDPMEEFIDQTLGGVVEQLRTIVYAIVIIGMAIVMLTTVLYLKLRLAKDLSGIAILKALGFSQRDINKQYLIKIGCVSSVGILVGVILTVVLGEQLVNAALSVSGLGINKVALVINPAIQYLVCPLVLLTLMLIVTGIVVRTVHKYNIISLIKE